MMGWDCARCGKQIEDTRYQRELRLGDYFVPGECSLCIECANLDRPHTKITVVEIDIRRNSLDTKETKE